MFDPPTAPTKQDIIRDCILREEKERHRRVMAASNYTRPPNFTPAVELRNRVIERLMDHEACERQFETQIQVELGRYQHQLMVWDARRRLPCFSESLSSLHRPQVSSTAADLISSLHENVLHPVLSFVPDYEFFFVFPCLSHRHACCFTHPSLHRVYGRERFGLTTSQWLNFAERSWPKLRMPVHKYPYWYGEVAEEFKRQSDVLIQTENSCYRPAQLHSDLDKDWALESLHLYQHLHFATLSLLRHIPSAVSLPCGRRLLLRYHLPRLLRALLVDGLTSLSVLSMLFSAKVVAPESFLSLGYADCFCTRQSPRELVTVSMPRSTITFEELNREVEQGEEVQQDVARDLVRDPAEISTLLGVLKGRLMRLFPRQTNGVFDNRRNGTVLLAHRVAPLGILSAVRAHALWISPDQWIAVHVSAAALAAFKQTTGTNTVLDVHLDASPLLSVHRWDTHEMQVPCIIAENMHDWLRWPSARRAGSCLHALSPAEEGRLYEWLEPVNVGINDERSRYKDEVERQKVLQQWKTVWYCYIERVVKKEELKRVMIHDQGSVEAQHEPTEQARSALATQL